MIADIHDAGYQVDIIATTYACTNQKIYTDSIKSWYGARLKRFCVIPYKGSSQKKSYDFVVHLARDYSLQHKVSYVQYIVMRFDSAFSRWTNELLGARLPVDAVVAGDPNHDQLLIVPGSYSEGFFAVAFHTHSTREHVACWTNATDKWSKEAIAYHRECGLTSTDYQLSFQTRLEGQARLIKTTGDSVLRTLGEHLHKLGSRATSASCKDYCTATQLNYNFLLPGTRPRQCIGLCEEFRALRAWSEG